MRVDSTGEYKHKYDVIYMNMIFNYLLDAEVDLMITRSVALLNHGGHLIISYVSEARCFGYPRMEIEIRNLIKRMPSFKKHEFGFLI